MDLNQMGWWLLLRWPSARLVFQGMLDGNAGMTPQMIDSYYYMGGYRLGRARFLDRSQAEP